MIGSTDFTDVDPGSLLSELLWNCIVATSKLLGKGKKKQLLLMNRLATVLHTVV